MSLNLSTNSNITWEIVEANPDKPWDFDELSGNPNITWEIVEANPDKYWTSNGLSWNPNITWSIIETNPYENWDWNGLSQNIFKKEKEQFERRIKYQKYVRENIQDELTKRLMNKNKTNDRQNFQNLSDDLDVLLQTIYNIEMPHINDNVI